MPVGAIVFAEHWLFPLLGVAQYRAERRGRFINWAALLTWAVTLAFCFLVLGKLFQVHLFYLWLPGYLLALFLYTGLSALAGAGEMVEAATAAGGTAATAGSAATALRAEPSPASGGSLPRWRRTARALAAASLAAILGAALARVLTGMDAGTFYVLVNVSTLVWFASGTLWLTPGLFGIPEVTCKRSSGCCGSSQA